MRRFSQRNSLVTLNDINITPLLDLAFVLLIIFVITRPLMEQSIDLNLYRGGQEAGKIEARDVKTVEVSVQGNYRLNGVNVSLAQLIGELDRATRANPQTVVYIRADENSLNKYVYAVIDNCQRRGISRFSLRTAPDNSR